MGQGCGGAPTITKPLSAMPPPGSVLPTNPARIPRGREKTKEPPDQSWLGTVVLSLNSSAAFITMKAGLVIGRGP